MLTVRRAGWLAGLLMLATAGGVPAQAPTDPLHDLQDAAWKNKFSPIMHWGTNPKVYADWSTHSNRLIPVYTFGTLGAGPGIDLTSYQGKNSPYRDEAKLRKIFGGLPTDTLDPKAEHFDQTNIFDIQKAALDAGKKRIILVVFDGMDWHSTRAAALYQTGKVYTEGRGAGLFFQDYGAKSQFGFMCTTPVCDDLPTRVDTQTVPPHELTGGYDRSKAGGYPWSRAPVFSYPISKDGAHQYTDSSASATSMTSGLKTYNGSMNVTVDGTHVPTIAHLAQAKGYAVGAVTSVPFPHATPGCAYAHNVSRDDYQDLARDMLGLPSVAHPSAPLAGMDVVIGSGWGVTATTKAEVKKELEQQGTNFVVGNKYITDADLNKIDAANGGRYVVSQRTAGQKGSEKIKADAAKAIADKKRLFGFYGTKQGNLPYRTADGDYVPSEGKNGLIAYKKADLDENPKLADLAEASLAVLSAKSDRFWMMLEAGDVDFASHTNNVDTMIGAILSGDQAVKAVANWVETHGGWDDTIMIVTADHGHYLTITDLEGFARLSPKRMRK